MTTAGLRDAFTNWSAQKKPLVLASVFETAGSTYSKVGAQMLITGDGKFQGMLSGGCLEGDLAARASHVLQSGEPQSVTYDLGSNDEELWGLGVGCDGLMKIFLQPLNPDTGYEPFATMLQALAGDSEQVAAIVVESTIENLPMGAALVAIDGTLEFGDVADEFIPQVSNRVSDALLARRSDCQEIVAGNGKARLLLSLLRPPPSILVLGAGLDAEPVVRFATELGWRVTVQDHRPAYIQSGNFERAEHIHCLAADDIASTLDLDRYAAAIVMSHHLVSDRQYLSQLAGSAIPYIGLLGPVDRRRRLLRDLDRLSDKLEFRLHGPAGIDIGGRGPASIALSIIAEMHQELIRPAD
jgi:xanthine/CO dehydrogenase XdhC/CoxF family maturation factor